MVPPSPGSRQTMALPTTRPLLGSCGTPTLGSLLFLLFSLGWVQPSRALAGETTQEAAPLDGVLTNAPNIARWVRGLHSPQGLFSGLLPQVATLIDRFVMGRGQLDKDTLDTLTAFCPGCLCSLSPEQLSSMPPSIIWVVRPQDLDTCGPRQLDILYPKAHLAFQNLSRSEYFVKIQSFLGGASTEDLKALSQQNVSMDLATFMKLRREAVLPLTVAEVQKLLGPHVAGLKVEEQHSPVRDWIRQQRQDDLDTLGLGLQGGIPNGYLILDLSVREALSGTPCLLGPGPVLTVLALLLASTLA
ncbi:hypothetical protein H8958_004775 [Nasalis larvatus]